MPGFGAVRGVGLRSVVCAAVVMSGCAGLGAAAVRTKPARVATLTPWEQAERGRESLESTPETRRTKADYNRAIERYRAIYHANPADMHAPESIYAVAGLLAEQGHLLSDEKSSHDAIGQYEFLRKQYPGSSLRIPALLAEGQIEQNDLHYLKAARTTYQMLLKKYPRSDAASEASDAMAEIDRPDRLASSRTATRASAPGKNTVSKNSSSTVATPIDAVSTSADTTEDLNASTMPVSLSKSPQHAGKLAMVTGIRHWSTPTYTRVAIDLGDEVQYEAARVPNPARIYFDLHGSRLAQELTGKSFSVTDDGFLKRIRVAQFSNDMTRVVLDVNDVTEYTAFLLPNPYRLIIDIHGTKTSTQTASIGVLQPPAKPAKAAATVPNTVATKQSTTAAADVEQLSDQPNKVVATKKPTSQAISAVVDVAPAPDPTPASVPAPVAVASSTTPVMLTSKTTVASANKKTKGKKNSAVSETAAPVPAALKTADGQTSLVRALGLKIGRIVIDPGHGGHDSGTLGAGGIEEKDVVLDVALRLGKLLHERLGSEIIYTRSDDTFIPLETRTAIANKAQADLFISVHANSSRDDTARGVETYYLNFTSEPDALDVAARENAVSTQSIHELSDMVKKIALKEKIDESREFASDVEQSLYNGLESGNAGLKNRGVKKAPFVVLIGANMPSILAEISFVTNPKDAEQLQRPDYRQRVAESLYRGVAKYAGGLSGVRTPMERAAVSSSADDRQ